MSHKRFNTNLAFARDVREGSMPLISATAESQATPALELDADRRLLYVSPAWLAFYQTFQFINSAISEL